MNTGKSIIFENRMRKSYRVKCIGFETKNERGAHVETHVQGIEGQEFKLGGRSCKQINGCFAVMYEVVNLKNRDNPAHITVYFGNNEEQASLY